MKIARQLTATLIVALMAGVSLAHTGHKHGDAGHDHETMMKNEKKISKALSALSAEDQKLAKAQRFCPIMTYDRLGAMGTPLKVMIEGIPIFLCCKACKEDAVKNGEKTVKTLMKLRDSTETLAKLPMDERMAIEAQKYCAVANTSFLGSMGNPIKLEIDGKPVYLCCNGCTKKAQSDPAGTLANAQKLIRPERIRATITSMRVTSIRISSPFHRAGCQSTPQCFRHERRRSVAAFFFLDLAVRVANSFD